MSTALYPKSPPTPPAAKPNKFVGLSWSALFLGTVGVVGSPIILFNNLTAIAAMVGVVLGVIALFGTRKVVAGIGVGLSIAAVAVTVLAQQQMTEEIFGTTNEGAVSDAVNQASDVDSGVTTERDQAVQETPTGASVTPGAAVLRSRCPSRSPARRASTPSHRP